MEQIPAFYFDRNELFNLAEQYHNTFLTAKPFPNVIIDHLIPDEILNLIADEFPNPDQIDWNFWGPGETKHTGNKYFEKIGTSDETKFGPFTRHFMGQLNSATFIKFLEKLTGIEDIIPDPTFNRCGLHSTGPGGKLMIHADANRHPMKGKFHQQFNLILFINKDWKEEYGGHLELWNRTATQCETKILPVFNRIVIFETGKYSYHGHPVPLTCPEDRRRNSLAVYYYVLDRPSDENYSGIQGIKWVPMSAEETRFAQKERFRRILKKLTPPVLYDLFTKKKSS